MEELAQNKTSPWFVFGRLNPVDGYSLLHESDKGSPNAQMPMVEIRREAERLSLEWWGDCGDGPRFSVAVGHVRLQASASIHLVWKVLKNQSPHPFRLVVAVPDSVYCDFGYSPFRLRDAGFFDFANEFMRDPKLTGPFLENSAEVIDPETVVPSLNERQLAKCAECVDYLNLGKSVVIENSGQSELVDWFMEFVFACLSDTVRARTSLMSFTFNPLSRIPPELAPLFACRHQPGKRTWSEGIPESEWNGPSNALTVVLKLYSELSKNATAPEDDPVCEEERVVPNPVIEDVAVGRDLAASTNATFLEASDESTLISSDEGITLSADYQAIALMRDAARGIRQFDRVGFSVKWEPSSMHSVDLRLPPGHWIARNNASELECEIVESTDQTTICTIRDVLGGSRIECRVYQFCVDHVETSISIHVKVIVAPRSNGQGCGILDLGLVSRKNVRDQTVSDS